MYLWPSQNIRTLEKSWQSQILFSLETKFSARNIESIKFDDIFHGIINKCFVHPIFRFWFLVTFDNMVTKILHNLCLHFARHYGQDGKKTERKSRN